MTKSNRRGFAVVTVIFIATIFSVLGMTAVAMLSGSAKKASDEYSSQQAFNVAEAGVAYVSNVLAADADWSDNPPITMAFGPGSFTVTFPAKSSTSATVRSDGTVQGIVRSIEIGMSKGGGSLDFTKAFYTEGDIEMSGSSSGTIEGDILAGGTIDNSSTVVVNGDEEASSDQASIPNPIWSYWQALATTTISGNYNFPSGTHSGIFYVDGDVTFSKNVMLNGTLIARGSVTMAGNENIVITAVSPNPAIIAEGAILFSGTSDVVINGWVITLSTLTMTGTTGVSASGGFIAAGDVTFTGNSDTNVSFVAPTAGGETVPGFIGISGSSPILFGTWREVY